MCSERIRKHRSSDTKIRFMKGVLKRKMSISEKSIEYGSDEVAEKQKALRESGNMNADFSEMARNVYAHLNDEISKKTFLSSVSCLSK